MHPEHQRLVDFAADISASGRWAAANDKIVQLSANPGKGNEWWVQLIGSLLAKSFEEYIFLKRSYADEKCDPALLAWRARNLLELSTWCMYCVKSRENARRLYEDAGRDEQGLYDAFRKWGTARAQGEDFLDIFENATQNLTNRAAAEGIASLDGRYKDVRDAADDVGIGDHYILGYRMLSKFTHPTAFRILSVLNDETAKLQRDLFFSFGCLFFVGAFTAIEPHLS
jgi:hypothetical protein